MLAAIWLENAKKTICEWIFYGMIGVPAILFFMFVIFVVVLFYIGLCLVFILDFIFRFIHRKFKKPSLLSGDYFYKEL